METTGNTNASSIISLYCSIEKMQLKNVFKIGEKMFKIEQKSKSKKDESYKLLLQEVGNNKNVKLSLLQDYKRFFVNLAKAEIEIRKVNKDAKIVELIENSNILYTKATLLSKIAPLHIFELLNNAEYLVKLSNLTVSEMENFKHLLNVGHKSIDEAFELAPKDKFTAFQDELNSILNENSIDAIACEQEESIDYKAVLAKILRSDYNLDINSFKSEKELFDSIQAVVEDIKNEQESRIAQNS